jgi:hypothetical protein
MKCKQKVEAEAKSCNSCSEFDGREELSDWEKWQEISVYLSWHFPMNTHIVLLAFIWFCLSMRSTSLLIFTLIGSWHMIKYCVQVWCFAEYYACAHICIEVLSGIVGTGTHLKPKARSSRTADSRTKAGVKPWAGTRHDACQTFELGCYSTEDVYITYWLCCHLLNSLHSLNTNKPQMLDD